ncbi:hypothetical protein FJY63_13550, partial [Candidatus Sumerlaeota bacterium]|nr:hypothetical protein [Candidatus Sumerlaeota bacterium]
MNRLPDWLLHRSPEPIAAAFERRRWRRQGYLTPLPVEAKRAVLRRHGGAPDLWIETGTYVGDTTAMLAMLARQVVSFEPSPFYFQRAQARFAHVGNVIIENEPSEQG